MALTCVFGLIRAGLDSDAYGMVGLENTRAKPYGDSSRIRFA